MKSDPKTYIKAFACSVCLKSPPSDCHHWKTRGSGGSDDVTNLVSLCRWCHSEFHATGVKTFWTKHKEKIIAFRKAHGLPPLNVIDTEPPAPENG